MIFLELLSRLPLRVLYLFADFLFFLSFYVIRYRRKLVRKNLANSFPEYGPERLALIEKGFYKNLCDYAVETLKGLTISKEELQKRLTFSQTAVLQEYKETNQSAIVLTSHQFNWEWLIAAANFSLPLPFDFVYQPVSNPTFNVFSYRCRTRFGAYAIKRDEVARETIKRKNVHRCIAILADQYPGHKSDKRHLTTFMNQETVFFKGACQLAIMTQYPVVYGAIRKIRRGYYEASFYKIAEPPYGKEDFSMIDQYVKAVEETIRQHPDGWLWSHNRWKKRHLQNPQ